MPYRGSYDIFFPRLAGNLIERILIQQDSCFSLRGNLIHKSLSLLSLSFQHSFVLVVMAKATLAAIIFCLPPVFGSVVPLPTQTTFLPVDGNSPYTRHSGPFFHLFKRTCNFENTDGGYCKGPFCCLKSQAGADIFNSSGGFCCDD